jgi:formylglycine-generating enzyme required for sulfatase activity
MGSLPAGISHVGEDLPVYGVSWIDIQTFVAQLNLNANGSNPGLKKYRLPREAEWEYAARGGKKDSLKIYAGGDILDLVAWYADNSDARPHFVGTKAPNKLDIFDMSGNVWEWVNDRYGSYTVDAKTDPQGPSSGASRVVRGGGWNSDAASCGVTSRSSRELGDNSGAIGFRLVRELVQ